MSAFFIKFQYNDNYREKLTIYKKHTHNIKLYTKTSEESLPQVLSVYAWQRETNDSFKKVISQIIAEAMLNISSILNNFKSFIKKVYKKEWTQNIKKKKDQNNYF